MINGFENQIKTMRESDILDSLSIALPICAELYCGVRKNDFNEDVMVEAIRFIYKYYSDLGATEIKLAFELCACNKFNNINMTAYYGNFNIAMLGDILSAYKLERNKILNKLIDQQKRGEQGEAFKSEIDHKNYLTRIAVVDEFNLELKNIKSGISRKYESYKDIPLHWCKILVDRGIINLEETRKRELWGLAKDLVRQELNHKSKDFTDYKVAQSVRVMLRNLEGSGSQTLKDKAEIIYGKLYVWEFLK